MAEDSVDRAATVVSRICLVGVGVALGFIGSFLVPQRLAGVPGISVVIAGLGNLAAGLIGGIGLRTPGNAALPGVGWFVVIGLTSAYLPGGDVILPGTLGNDPRIVTVGVAFMVAGVVGTALAMVLTAVYTRRRRAPTSIG